MWIIDKINRE